MSHTTDRKARAASGGSQRVFLALPTPPAVRAHLEELSSRLQTAGADVRWEAPEKMHVTVKFLGPVPLTKLDTLGEALDDIARVFSPFPVTYAGLGAFPSMRSPRVLWVGMEDPSGTLHHLQQHTERVLAERGFPPEERSFHPHVTLGRVRSTAKLGRLLAMVESLTLERHAVQLRDILLVQSELKPHGSVYTTLRSATFVGNQTHRE